eukprot:6204818-Pleurochrysis_carterae.AAC.2
MAALAAPFCWFLMRWAHSPPQERKRPAPPDADHLQRASALSCARTDAMHRMFNSVAKLHISSVACCFTIMAIHTYWIHGSRVLGIAEPVNPTLVTHASHIDLSSLTNGIATISTRTVTVVPRICFRWCNAPLNGTNG